MSDELRQRAIRLLSRREYTRAELAVKLAALGTHEEIEAVLADMEAASLQSDRRTAESWLRGKAAGLGLASLRRTLKSRGLERELVEEEIARAGLPDEMERARALWRRKYSAAPVDAKEWARQARFLQSRGFSGDIVRRLLRETAGEDR